MNKKTLVTVSEQLLSSIELEQQINMGDDIDANYITVHGSSNGLTNTTVITPHSDKDAIKIVTAQNEDEMMIENIIIGMRSMPDNATIWDLVKAQVQADFA